MKNFIIAVFLISPFISANAQKIEGYNGFEFGMSKDAALFICDVRDYFIDTNYSYDADAQIPPTLSSSFIYYLDSIDVNGTSIPLDVTLYFDPYNGDELFNINVSIKSPARNINEAKSYFNVLLETMKEKYGTSYIHSNDKDTSRLVNSLFQRKFEVYDWDLDNGRVSLEHDISSFYVLNDDYYYTDELKEFGFLEVTIFYFDTDKFFRFTNSKNKIEGTPLTPNEELKQKL
jgi:hypothetical protein